MTQLSIGSVSNSTSMPLSRNCSRCGLAAAVAVPAASSPSVLNARCSLPDIAGSCWNADVDVCPFAGGFFLLNADVYWVSIFIGTGGAAGYQDRTDEDIGAPHRAEQIVAVAGQSRDRTVKDVVEVTHPAWIGFENRHACP